MRTKAKSRAFRSYADALSRAVQFAERARLDRPQIIPPSKRRRCGDVIRWKENNETIDQIVSDLRAEQKATQDGR